MNPIAIGAGVGALSSLLGGSRQSGTMRTSQDFPPWLKDYTVKNLDMAQGVRDRLTTGGANPLLERGEDELFKTLSGGYLLPESNPHLKSYGDAISDRIGASVDSRFSAAGRYGSGAHQGTLATSIGDVLSGLYGNAYNMERGRMFSGALAAPGVVSGGVSAQFEPLASFANLFPNLKVEEQPLYRNKAGELLSGALTGAGLGYMYGGGSSPLDPLSGAGAGDLPPRSRTWA